MKNTLWEPAEYLPTGKLISTSRGFRSMDVDGKFVRPTMQERKIGYPCNQSKFLESLNDDFCRLYRDQTNQAMPKLRIQFFAPSSKESSGRFGSTPLMDELESDFECSPWYELVLPPLIRQCDFPSVQYMGGRQILLLTEKLSGIHCEFSGDSSSKLKMVQSPVEMPAFRTHEHCCMPCVQRGWVAFPCCSVSLRLSDLSWKKWPFDFGYRSSYAGAHPIYLCTGGYLARKPEFERIKRFELDPKGGHPILVDSFCPKITHAYDWKVRWVRGEELLILVGRLEFELIRLGKPSVSLALLSPPNNFKSLWLTTTDERGDVICASKTRVWRQKRTKTLFEKCAIRCPNSMISRQLQKAIPEISAVRKAFGLKRAPFGKLPDRLFGGPSDLALTNSSCRWRHAVRPQKASEFWSVRTIDYLCYPEYPIVLYFDVEIYDVPIDGNQLSVRVKFFTRETGKPPQEFRVDAILRGCFEGRKRKSSLTKVFGSIGSSITLTSHRGESLRSSGDKDTPAAFVTARVAIPKTKCDRLFGITFETQTLTIKP